jgi:hypothetical protein
MNIQSICKEIEKQLAKPHPRTYIPLWDEMCKYVDSQPLIRPTPDVDKKASELGKMFKALCENLPPIQLAEPIRPKPYSKMDNIGGQLCFVNSTPYFFDELILSRSEESKCQFRFLIEKVRE